MPKALHEVVVDNTAGLEKCVANCGSDEGEAIFLQRLADAVGQRRGRRDLAELLPAALNDLSFREGPNERIERAVRLLQFQKCLRVVNCGSDFHSISYDGWIANCSLDFSLGHLRNFVRDEIVEHTPEGLSLVQHRPPREPGLKGVQHYEFKPLSVIVYRLTPFIIMVAKHQSVIVHPAAPAFVIDIHVWITKARVVVGINSLQEKTSFSP